MPIDMWILRKLLAAINRHKVRGWIALLIYVPFAIFPHETVQYYANEIAIRYTHKRLYQGSAVVAIALGVIVTLMFLLAVRKQPERRAISLLWLLTLILFVGTWGTFMANNTELVHFPQYFPEGMVLLALTASPVESIAWATIFGGLDECFQYWVLVKGKPVPYDFNDIFMDLLGGAAGVVFAMALMRTEHRESARGWWKDVLKRPGILVILGVVASGIVLWVAGVMTLSEPPNAPPHWFSLSRQQSIPFWFSSPKFFGPDAPNFFGPLTFHELSPVQGPVLLLAALAAWSLLDRRFRISAPEQ
jgi:multisubunit Na+/H+ antiporter MnhB subunit